MRSMGRLSASQINCRIDHHRADGLSAGQGGRRKCRVRCIPDSKFSSIWGEREIAVVKFHAEAMEFLTHFWQSGKTSPSCWIFHHAHNKRLPCPISAPLVWCGECSGAFAG